MDIDKRDLLIEQLRNRIFVLNEAVWERSVSEPILNEWLENFDGRVTDPSEERLCALYVISHFMYFGSREIRVLLRAMYRDLFLIPLLADIQVHNPHADPAGLQALINEELMRTRFLGIGNPSESGVHLLYYFRQENSLPRESFADSSRILRTVNGVRELADPNIKRYIFIDDVCGSGDTAIDYAQEVVSEVLACGESVQFEYHTLMGTARGLGEVRRRANYASVKAIYELDSSYEYTGEDSRYFSYCPEGIEPDLVRRVVREYGAAIFPGAPLGWSGGDLLLGFHHNTPDNTLPIVWAEAAHDSGITAWVPAFKRYPKYGLLPS